MGDGRPLRRRRRYGTPLRKQCHSLQLMLRLQTTSAMKSFFLAMALYPDIQRRAQAEVDRAVGGCGTRLPTADDQPALVYLDAIIKEVLRWAPVAELGTPSFIRDLDLCVCRHVLIWPA